MYDSDPQTFWVELHSLGIKITFSLADVVRKKWETGECFSKASIMCAGDLICQAEKEANEE